MRSSGSLRYLRNTELTSSIQKYYEVTVDYLEDYDQLFSDFYKTHIQPYCINHFMIRDYDVMNDSMLTQSPVFLNRTHETEVQLINIMGNYESYLGIYLAKNIASAIKAVNSLIEMLKKEYHMK